ncbi:MAG: hypothetical protein ABH885_07075, partial [Candidatus Omnitrophota bacterium]
ELYACIGPGVHRDTFSQFLTAMNWARINAFRKEKKEFSLEYNPVYVFEGRPVASFSAYKKLREKTVMRKSLSGIFENAWYGYRRRLGDGGLPAFGGVAIWMLNGAVNRSKIKGRQSEQQAAYNLRRIFEHAIHTAQLLSGRDLVMFSRVALVRTIRRADHLLRDIAGRNIVDEFTAILVRSVEEAMEVPDGWANGMLAIKDEDRLAAEQSEETLVWNALRYLQDKKDGALASPADIARVLASAGRNGWTSEKVSAVCARIDFSEWNKRHRDELPFPLDPPGDNGFVEKQDRLIRVLERDFDGISYQAELNRKINSAKAAQIVITKIMNQINWPKINQIRESKGKVSLEPDAINIFEGMPVARGDTTRGAIAAGLKGKIRGDWVEAFNEGWDAYNTVVGKIGINGFMAATIPVLAGIMSRQAKEGTRLVNPRVKEGGLATTNLRRVLCTIVRCAESLKGHADLNLFTRLVVLRAFRLSGDLWEAITHEDINGSFSDVLIDAVCETLPVSRQWLNKAEVFKTELAEGPVPDNTVYPLLVGKAVASREANWAGLHRTLTRLRKIHGFVEMWEHLPGAVQTMLKSDYESNIVAMRKRYMLAAVWDIIKESRPLIAERRFQALEELNDGYDAGLMFAEIFELPEGLQMAWMDVITEPMQEKADIDAVLYWKYGIRLRPEDAYPPVDRIDEAIFQKTIGVKDPSEVGVTEADGLKQPKHLEYMSDAITGIFDVLVEFMNCRTVRSFESKRRHRKARNYLGWIMRETGESRVVYELARQAVGSMPPELISEACKTQPGRSFLRFLGYNNGRAAGLRASDDDEPTAEDLLILQDELDRQESERRRRERQKGRQKEAKPSGRAEVTGMMPWMWGGLYEWANRMAEERPRFGWLPSGVAAVAGFVEDFVIRPLSMEILSIIGLTVGIVLPWAYVAVYAFIFATI